MNTEKSEQEKYYEAKNRRAKSRQEMLDKVIIALKAIFYVFVIIGAIGGALYFWERKSLKEKTEEIPALRGQVQVIKRGGERDQRQPVYP